MNRFAEAYLRTLLPHSRLHPRCGADAGFVDAPLDLLLSSAMYRAVSGGEALLRRMLRTGRRAAAGACGSAPGVRPAPRAGGEALLPVTCGGERGD